MKKYGVDIWAKDNYIIKQDKVHINYKSSPTIYDIVSKIREDGLRGPLLLRFPHLIKKQIDSLFESFKHSFDELEYNGDFKAVFPLKVNQFPNFIEPLLKSSKEYDYGLEAGSKAELLLAMYKASNRPILVNGFKDRELINLAFLSAQMGQDITLTIEGIHELESIIEVAKTKSSLVPKIGIRIKLHGSSVGVWAKSVGANSKFGLTSTELIEAVNLMKKHNLIEHFHLIHFHIGSQITTIQPLKKALKEAGHIYSDLINLGSYNLNTINLGGGLAIEYSQTKPSINYSLQEYCNDIVFMLQTIAKNKGVDEPNIIIESGRYVSAPHAMLVAPVFELFSQEYSLNALKLKEKNPAIIDELYELYQDIDKESAREFLHDSFDHLNSIFTLFDLGYVDLVDRSNAEILAHLIMKKSVALLQDSTLEELLRIKDLIQEKYLMNFSTFQSLADFWGLKQHFPIMPLSKLNLQPSHSANLWDITCDSDGEIAFSEDEPLYLHEVDLENEDYFIGIFLIGAYQEILGMRHNLFAHPSEATIIIDDEGYKIDTLQESSSIIDILDDLGYKKDKILALFYSLIEENRTICSESKERLKIDLENILNENGYLKTID